MEHYKKYPVTSVLIGLCVIYYIYTSMIYSFDMSAYEGLLAGAFNPFYVFSFHQYYRLITSNFVHFGLLHVAVNCYSLYNVGSFLESLISRKNYIIVCLISGLSTTLLPAVLYLFNGFGIDSISGGISGMIFGICGAVLALSLFYKNELNGVFKSLGTNLIIMLFISLIVPSISLSGHVSGLIGGFVSMYIIMKKRKKNRFYS